MDKYILPVIAALVVGFVIGTITGLAVRKQEKYFTDTEILLITQRIEALKNKDVTLYTSIMGEWKTLVHKGEYHLTRISGELTRIISLVRNS